MIEKRDALPKIVFSSKQLQQQIGETVESLSPSELAFAEPEKEIKELLLLVTSPEKKTRKRAKQELIKIATQGSVNNLLDVTNSILAFMMSLRKPEIAAKTGIKLPSKIQKTQSQKYVRDFTQDFFKALSSESRIYVLDFGRTSIKAKAKTTQVLLSEFNLIFSENELSSLPLGFRHFQIMLSEPLVAPQVSVSFCPELLQFEASKLAHISRKNPAEISQQEFNLVMKAHQNYYQDLGQESFEFQIKIFEQLEIGDFARNLAFFANSINSPDPAVRNRTLMVLVEGHRQFNSFVEKQLLWRRKLQKLAINLLDGEVVNDDLKLAFFNLITNLEKHQFLLPFFKMLSVDYANLLSKVEFESEKTLMDAETKHCEILDEKLAKTEVENYAIELLVKASREFAVCAIDQEVFLELFDRPPPIRVFLG